VWPAVLVCGGVFAVVQFFWSNFIGPESSTSPAASPRSWRWRSSAGSGSRPRSGSSLRCARRRAPVRRHRAWTSAAPPAFAHGCPGCFSASWSRSGALAPSRRS
jgi:hypothetical protein